MLIDDEERFVELFVDNLMWGNITIDWVGILKDDKKHADRLAEYLRDYMRARTSEVSDDTLLEATVDLAAEIRAVRAVGMIKGELRDREQEKEIESLRKDKAEAAKKLSKMQDLEKALKESKPVDKDFKAIS